MKALFIPILASILSLSGPAIMAQNIMSVYGHRGARGLMPENTMPGFLKAIGFDVHGIEMDLVVSADGQLILSDSPWLSHQLCSDGNGKPLTRSQEKEVIILKMTYPEIQNYDCGMRAHPDFPSQQMITAVRPTLKMVIRSVQRFVNDNGYTEPQYIIELKSDPRRYDVFYPKPHVFADLVVNEIRRLDIEERTILTSSDPNVILQLFNTSSRLFKIGYVGYSPKKMARGLDKLTIPVEYFLPATEGLTQAISDEAHSRNMLVLPWPVNTAEELANVTKLGADGILSDYPDVMAAILKEENQN